MNIESLESRLFLSITPTADPGERPKTAYDLGSFHGTDQVRESLSKKDRDDYYRFSVASRGNFNLSLGGLKNNADVQLLDRKGAVVAQSIRSGTSSEKISLSLPKGRYYVRVSGAATTPYKLTLSADLNWGTVRDGADRRDIGLVWADGSTRRIRGDRETWITIHGWNSNPDGQAISHLSRALDGLPGKVQVLELDWSSAAKSSSIITSAGWTDEIGELVADKLASWGLTTAEVNLAGHSLGGLVADRIAAEAKGGVNRILAIDPATDLPGLFISGTDYADNSRYSVGFIASSYATPEAATTADEAFRVNIGSFNSIVTHSNVVDLVADMIEENNAGSPDRISALFDPAILGTTKRPFRPNAYSGGFEGTLTATRSGSDWNPTTLVYKNRNGKEITLRA